MFNNSYRDKKVLVTGHTGFKGTWLTTWLLKLGAEVIGISKNIPTNPSMFESLNLESKITHYVEDIKDLSVLTDLIGVEQPDFIFHLAAQPIVSTSYKEPIETISTNVMGTANVLESVRISNHKCIVIIITSDKGYENVEQVWGYKEDDKMGGKDIYSGSKGAAELIIHSYFNSFFKYEGCHIKLAIGRAGNVIGGGDWASDRIVVDCMESWSKGESVEIRSPQATRPWQHVLEPLSGYLSLGMDLERREDLHGEAFNFGPRAEQNHTVVKLLEDLSRYWSFNSLDDVFKITDDIPFHEAGLLKLNCDKALSVLNWAPSLTYEENIKFTSQWYVDFYKTENDMYHRTVAQIKAYEKIAEVRGVRWTE